MRAPAGLAIASHNAGISGPGAALVDYLLEGWAQFAAMLKNGGGLIINVASVLGAVGIVGSTACVAAKHGVVGLTLVAAPALPMIAMSS